MVYIRYSLFSSITYPYTTSFPFRMRWTRAYWELECSSLGPQDTVFFLVILAGHDWFLTTLLTASWYKICIRAIRCSPPKCRDWFSLVLICLHQDWPSPSRTCSYSSQPAPAHFQLHGMCMKKGLTNLSITNSIFPLNSGLQASSREDIVALLDRAGLSEN